MRRTILKLVGGMVAAIAVSGSAYATQSLTMVGQLDPNRCYANVLTPEKSEIVTKRVAVQAAYDRKRYIPAINETQRIRVKTKEAAVSYVAVPAQYETVFVDVLVEPAKQINVEIPAKYETWTETIEVEPAKVIWKRGNGVFGRAAPRTAINATERSAFATGEVLCRVRIPAKTRSVRHTRMVSAPRTETQTIPAEYRTIAKQIIRRPAQLTRTYVPAEYAAIPVTVPRVPARIAYDRIPAQFADVTERLVTQFAQLQRAEVMCDRTTTRMKVAELQSALVDRGYEIKIDGIYGPETQGAMERFQHDNGLSNGYMTVETTRALGVDPYACEPPGCVVSPPQRTIAATQRALSAAGYPTAVDGIYGPKTRAALEKFQRDQNLKVGFLSAQTMTSLNVVALI